jgi:hypothetical protein
MMNALKLVSGFLATSLLAGCASMDGAKGPRGPRLVGSGRATEYGQYAEIGVEFSSMGDFVALVSPKRWKSPIATGGSLSWMNPVAWSEDAGRTGRILLGEAVVVGGVAAAAAGGGGGGSSGDGGISSGDTGPGSVGAPPSVPSGRPPE